MQRLCTINDRLHTESVDIGDVAPIPICKGSGAHFEQLMWLAAMARSESSQFQVDLCTT